MNMPAGSAQHADLLAQGLASPDPPAEHARQAQSLAEGAAGVALLHIERAHIGAGSWKTARLWVKAATRQEISAADSTGLYAGAPAIAFVLHAAGADGIERYAAALGGLDAHVAALAHRRVGHALARMARGDRPAFAEYDLLHGLTGIGAHLLQHAPGSDALGRILAYLARLTEPVRADSESLPGWWTFHDPNLRVTSGGHANLGMAHGIGGQLALLAQARRRGVTVEGHADAIERICAFLDCWRQDGTTGHWWPPWLTRADLRAGRPAETGRAGRAGATAPPVSPAPSNSPLSLPATSAAATWPRTPWPDACPIQPSSARSPTPACATAGPGCTRPRSARPATRSPRASACTCHSSPPGSASTPTPNEARDCSRAAQVSRSHCTPPLRQHHRSRDGTHA